MKVKRFLGHDVNEAMYKVKNELGKDAIILHTRKIRKPGIMGLFKKPLIEIVAAVEAGDGATDMKITPSKPPSINFFTKPQQNDDINIQIDSIKEMLNTVLWKLDNTQASDSSRNIMTKQRDILIKNNINNAIADKILNIVSRQISISDKNEESIKNAIKVIIKEFLGSPYEIDMSTNRQKVFFFIGPTGVGKTTTIAKLAAKLSLLNNKSVGLITADTYRIAAVEQLKTYSEILGIPLYVIYDPEDMNIALQEFSDKNYILVDTAGRNHNNKSLLMELNSLISNVEEPEIFLLVSLTTNYQDIVNIIKAYDFIKDYKIIFTKSDEATSLGNILNVRILTSKQISYITTGQSVPDDIELANVDKIAESLVGD